MKTTIKPTDAEKLIGKYLNDPNITPSDLSTLILGTLEKTDSLDPKKATQLIGRFLQNTDIKPSDLSTLILGTLEKTDINKLDQVVTNVAFATLLATEELKSAHRMLSIGCKVNESNKNLLLEKTTAKIDELINSTPEQIAIGQSAVVGMENINEISRICESSKGSSIHNSIKERSVEKISEYGMKILINGDAEQIQKFLDSKPILGSVIETDKYNDPNANLETRLLSYAIENLKSQPQILGKVVDAYVRSNTDNPEALGKLSGILESSVNTPSFLEAKILSDAIDTIPGHQNFRQKLSSEAKESFEQISGILIQIDQKDKQGITDPLSTKTITQLHEDIATLAPEISNIPYRMQQVIRLRMKLETEKYITASLENGEYQNAAIAAKSADSTGLITYSETKDPTLKDRLYFDDFLAAKHREIGQQILYRKFKPSEQNSEGIESQERAFEETRLKDFEQFISSKPILYRKGYGVSDVEIAFDKSLAADAIRFAARHADSKPEILDQVLNQLKEQNPQNEENSSLHYEIRDFIGEISNGYKDPEQTIIAHKISEHFKDFLIEDTEKLNSIIKNATEAGNKALIEVYIIAGDNDTRLNFSKETFELLLDISRQDLAEKFLKNKSAINNAIDEIQNSEHLRFVLEKAEEKGIIPNIKDKDIEKIVKLSQKEPKDPELLKIIGQSIAAKEDEQDRKNAFKAFVSVIEKHDNAAELLYTAIGDVAKNPSFPKNEKAYLILSDSTNSEYLNLAVAMNADEPHSESILSQSKLEGFIANNSNIIQLNSAIKEATLIHDSTLDAFKKQPGLFGALDEENLARLAPYLTQSLTENSPTDKAWQNQLLFSLVEKNGQVCKSGKELREKISEILFKDPEAIRKSKDDPFDQYFAKKTKYEKLEKSFVIVKRIRQFLQKRRAKNQKIDVSEYRKNKLREKLSSASAIINTIPITTPEIHTGTKARSRSSSI